MMKKLQDLCLLLSGIAVFAAMLTGCVKKPDYGPDPELPDGSIFDYATTVNIPLSVDYSMKGNKAVFEVYTENPVVVNDEGIAKKEGVKAILKAYTDKDCKYAGVVNLPTATDKVWLYSESYGLPTCVETQVTASAGNRVGDFVQPGFLPGESGSAAKGPYRGGLTSSRYARRIDP